MKRPAPFALLALALCAIWNSATAAGPISDFYRGRNLTISVGSAAGSGFTLYARLIARHLPKHIPGSPNIIIENLPGAAGLRHFGSSRNRGAQRRLSYWPPESGCNHCSAPHPGNFESHN